MTDMLLAGKIGFEALEQAPATLPAPGPAEYKALWDVFAAAKTVSGDWRAARDAIVKDPAFRAKFKALAKTLAALDTMMDEAAREADIRSVLLSL